MGHLLLEGSGEVEFKSPHTDHHRTHCPCKNSQKKYAIGTKLCTAATYKQCSVEFSKMKLQ